MKHETKNKKKGIEIFFMIASIFGFVGLVSKLVRINYTALGLTMIIGGLLIIIYDYVKSKKQNGKFKKDTK